LIALVAANKPAISLTDWASFLIMRERGIKNAFTSDRHFAQQGFHLLPGR
jgi:predicted nucleic acid-binding protein